MQIKQKEEDENLLKNTLILIVLNWTIVCLVQNIYIYITYTGKYNIKLIFFVSS